MKLPLRRAVFRCAAYCLGLLAAGTAAAGQDVWVELQRGGAAILIRHAQTVPGIGDPPGFRLDDCATQRNLSEAGRAQSRRFGEQLRARGIRVEEVKSSRWCRCLDTARLAFPQADVQVFEPLNSFFEDRSGAERQTAELARYVASLRGPGNVVLVTHAVNITALTGQGVAMGEALVVRADGNGGVRLVGRLPMP